MRKHFYENKNIISTYKKQDFIPPKKNSFVCHHYVGKNIVKPMHRHEYFEIEIVVSGKAAHVLNDNIFELKRGSAYFLNPSDFHKLVMSGDDDIELLNISFDMFFLDSNIIFDMINTSPQSVIEIDESNFEFIVDLSERIIKEYKTKSSYADIFIKNSIEIIAILLTQSKKNICDRLDPKIILNKNIKILHKILVYIHSYFKENITLDNIAEYMLLQKSYLCNIFKEALSKTIVQYINELRLIYSARLLKTYDLSITEICYECGYNTLSHFLRDFKKYYGISPLKYKNT